MLLPYFLILLSKRKMLFSLPGSPSSEVSGFDDESYRMNRRKGLSFCISSCIASTELLYLYKYNIPRTYTIYMKIIYMKLNNNI